MSEPVQGRRVPDSDIIKFGDWEPGCYGRVHFDDDFDKGWLWFCIPPNGVAAGVGGLSKHTITEHEDGTITVSPSILVHPAADAPGWHGYLERGVWREC
jgi:hypothetical protein